MEYHVVEMSVTEASKDDNSNMEINLQKQQKGSEQEVVMGSTSRRINQEEPRGFCQKKLKKHWKMAISVLCNFVLVFAVIGLVIALNRDPKAADTGKKEKSEIPNTTTTTPIPGQKEEKIYFSLRANGNQIPEKDKDVVFDRASFASFMSHDVKLSADGTSITILRAGRYMVKIQTCLFCQDHYGTSGNHRGMLTLYRSIKEMPSEKHALCSAYTKSGGQISNRCMSLLGSNDTLTLVSSVKQWYPRLTTIELERK